MEEPTQTTPFQPPSINQEATKAGASYTYYSEVPKLLKPSKDHPTGPPCALGIDEAGRGPVLGPMVYGIFYLPLSESNPLLKETHHFDDSKVLTPSFRTSLLQTLCAPGTALHDTCGWAVSSLSARDIAANMHAAYNLNAQAMDATAALLDGVLARGVNVREVYVDTIGQPEAYQRRLARLFPALRITVAKKADSLYPCVSAASVCAKVTRDAALDVLYEGRGGGGDDEDGWGSGYPSDARCVAWLRRNMHPVFGWGPECRFSWGTAKDMLEAKGGVKVEWPDDDDGASRLTEFFAGGEVDRDVDELGTWFGTPAGLEAF
ncbi:ribonuclease HII [Xylaria intraflava]|nr:ribonuclease HII [Xylaria intraflava]